MTHFLRNGSSFKVADSADLNITSSLPVGTYLVADSPESGYFLRAMESVQVSGKIYGDLEERCRRVFTSFEDCNDNVGVLLAGEKGSGKTLLAKLISIMGFGKGLPTIVVNEPLHGDRFNKFFQSIDQPCVVLFDEFEKIYDAEDQEKMLTLLDGTFQSHKIFVLTCNSMNRIDSHLRNRPGRIRYPLRFKGLAEDMISGYCLDKKVDPATLDSILKISRAFSNFNFDMLSTLVEECARFNETPAQAMKYLGFTPESDEGIRYSVFVEYKGVLLSREQQVPTLVEPNPLNYAEINVHFDSTSKPFAQEGKVHERILTDYDSSPSWHGEDENRVSVKVDTKKPILTKENMEFVIDADTKVFFVKNPTHVFNWDAF